MWHDISLINMTPLCIIAWYGKVFKMHVCKSRQAQKLFVLQNPTPHPPICPILKRYYNIVAMHFPLTRSSIRLAFSVCTWQQNWKERKTAVKCIAFKKRVTFNSFRIYCSHTMPSHIYCTLGTNAYICQSNIAVQ